MNSTRALLAANVSDFGPSVNFLVTHYVHKTQIDRDRHVAASSNFKRAPWFPRENLMDPSLWGTIETGLVGVPAWGIVMAGLEC